MVQKINSLPKDKIKTVILAGSRDFGRCPLASRLPAALWPVAGKNALESLLLHLADQGIKKAAICAGHEKSLLADSIHVDESIKIEYLEESLPAGTGGNIREAARGSDYSVFLLLPSSLICPPDIDNLINEHIKGESDLTVFLEPDLNCSSDSAELASGIYICNSSLLDLIPEDGYFDIKEGLIPKMLLAGKKVHAAKLPHRAGGFRDCHEYLREALENIHNIAQLNNLKLNNRNGSCNVWAGEEIYIDPAARIVGDVILMDGVRISEGAVIIGPALIEKNVTISKDSIIVNSIIWNDATIQDNCSIDHCVLDYKINLEPFTNVLEQCVASGTKILTKSSNKSNAKNTPARKTPVKINNTFTDNLRVNTLEGIKFLAPVLIFISFMWSYWPGLKDLWNTWMRSDEYSSGLLVPFLAVYILWQRRQMILQVPLKPAIFGLFIFLFAQALRIFGLFYLYGSAERLSIVLSIAGIVLLLYGWKLFIKVSTVLLFLFLMLPWPNRVQSAISLPLQSVSTSSAVFCLQVMGFDIIREGNVIHIGNATVAVAEACNGLRMITAFFVITGLVALLINRTWWEKLIVLVSSLPVAFLCNTLRLSITAIIFTIIKGPYWEKVFHDFGGYAMMPLALAFIVTELWLIDKLTIPPEEKNEIIIVRQKK